VLSTPNESDREMIRARTRVPSRRRARSVRQAPGPDAVAALRQLSLADWQRTAEHGEYSHYSVFIMFRRLALHDFFHAYRIEELLLCRDWADEWRATVGIDRQ
jgi:hypothetical protein